MPRPTKLTPDIQAKIINAISLGMTRELTAKFAGIGLPTLYGWLAMGRAGKAPYSKFADAVHEAEAKGALMNLAIIQQAAKKDWRAATWILQTRHGYHKGSEEVVHPSPAERASVQRLISEIQELDKKLEGLIDPVIDADDL